MITIKTKSKSAEQLLANDLQKYKNIEVSLSEAKKYDHSLFLADHREISETAVKDLRALLKNLGLYTYEAGSTKGSDMVGIVISNVPLSKTELKEYDYNQSND